MSSFSLAFVAEAVNGLLVGTNAEVSGVAIDSRTVRKGNLFVAMPGDNVDGHEYIAQAVAKGAVGAIVSRSGSYPCRVVIVDDTKLALQNLAKAYLQSSKVKVVAITGSVGKTSTKEMTASAVSAQMSVCKSLGNLNTEIGLPLSVLSHEDEEVLVLEMGMRGLGQIAELAEIAPPDIAIITNVGESHLELLGSRAKIAQAKGELLLGMKNGAVAILNCDDDFYNYLTPLARGPVTLVGQHRDADFRIQNPRPVSDGCYGFQLHSGLDTFHVVSPWPGAHNVYNAAFAIAAASALGVDIKSAIAALRLCGVGDKRLNLFTLPSGIHIIDDTYNASPTSTIAALQTLDEVSRGRRVAVLGGMLELGPRTEAGHREVGVAALGLCDLVIAVGDLAKTIALESEQGGLPTYWCENNSIALQLLAAVVRVGDTILVKGSRGLKMEEIVHALREGVV